MAGVSHPGNLNITGFKARMLLGTGRTAVVYLASDERGRDVALKVPRPGIMQDPVMSRVFYTEVVMLKSLEHPHVVRAYSGQPSGPQAHLAMQFFRDGELDPDTLMLEPSLFLMRDITSALEYCHAQRVVHQDVKPSNIYLDSGKAYLADFGAASSEQLPNPPAGSPFYMAPEIFRGERGTPKTDMYSFGVVAYELLTKTRPFLADTFEELQVQHLTQIPRPCRDVNSRIPQVVAKMVDRCLGKEPHFRPHAKEFRKALEDTLGKETQSPKPEQRPESPSSGAQVQLGRTVQRPEAALSTLGGGKTTASGKRPSSLLGRLLKRKS